MNVSWIVPGRVIYVQLPQAVTAQALTQGMMRIQKMCEAVKNERLVHCIFDCSRLKQINANLSNILCIFRRLPINGWLLTITAHFNAQKFVNFVTRNYNARRTQTVFDMPDACDFLETEDRSLSDLLEQYHYSIL